MVNKLRALTNIQRIALLIILVGIVMMVWYSIEISQFSKEIDFAIENNFAEGNVSADLLRPWMTIRFISASFAVPQAYIFDQINIQPRKETTLISLQRLNNQMQLGEINGEPVLVQKMREVITSYRENPIATGLIERTVQEWMSIQYIANSTGIPVESIFQYIGIPIGGNAYLPIGYLSDITNYEGGKKSLIKEIQKIVDEQGVKPVIP